LNNNLKEYMTQGLIFKKFGALAVLFLIVSISPIEVSAAKTSIKSNNNSPEVLYYGDWSEDNDQHSSNSPYSNCYFTFRKSEVRWIGSKGSDHGLAEVYIDGVFQETVDSYSEKTRSGQVLFEKKGLSKDKIHTLNIVVKREKNPESSGYFQSVDYFESMEPVDYRTWYKDIAYAELSEIAEGNKTFISPEHWKPVENRANLSTAGVTLLPGMLNYPFTRNIAYLNHCFASPTYCDGTGWTGWLPKSNDRRILQGAANTLRWGERSDMRNIVNSIVSKVEARQRADGYSNYYPRITPML